MDALLEAHLLREENSTNVRIENEPPLSVTALRAAFRVLGSASPEVAARVAERLFLSARRHPRPARELELLARAARFYVPTDDGQLPAWSWGQGPRVALLVHGWEGRGAQLGAFVDPLVERGFRVVAFDAPGHGDAEGDRASLFDHADAVSRLIGVVGVPDAIIAHSMGGMAVALALSASPAPDARLVFVAPPIDPARFAAHFASQLGIGPEVSLRLRGRVERRYGRSMDDLAGARLAAQLTSPLLIIHDEEDRDVPIDSGRALQRAWRGAELHATRGLGHRRVLRDRSVVATAVSFVSPRAHLQPLTKVPPRPRTRFQLAPIS